MATKKEENDYFAKVEKEKIKAQAERAAEAQAGEQAEKLRLQHWMHCPKDGNELVETTFRNARIDQCSWCGGVWLDRGELELLAGHEEGVLRHVLGQLLHIKR